MSVLRRRWIRTRGPAEVRLRAMKQPAVQLTLEPGRVGDIGACDRRQF